MAVYNVSAMNMLAFYQAILPETELILNSYGNLSDANIYFDNRLRSQPWKLATEDERKAALIEATELIDRLQYVGERSDSTQLHQFPRGGDVAVPREIEKACYEIALKLLDGYDPDMEVENLPSVGQGYSTVRSTYNRTFVLDHIRAGIPSNKAWNYLKPYLADPNDLTIRRVN